MHRHLLIAITMSFLAACGGGQSTESTTGSDTASQSSGSGSGGGEGAPDDNEFQLSDSDDAEQAHGEAPSQIEATETETAMRLFVVNGEDEPISNIVIKMTAPDGRNYYTRETDSVGYGEVLVPAGQRYEMEYLALGRRNTTANVDVPNRPNQDLRLTMRYRRYRPPAPDVGLVLDGIRFDTGRATIKEESFPRIDRVVEYMTYRTSTRIRISGHTDNVGNPRGNQRLSEARANAVRDYLVAHGIDGGRVEAVGRGDQDPVASNDTDEGRAQNRRIEAEEL